MNKTVIGLGLAIGCATAALAGDRARPADADIRFNEIQVPGTHNGYSQGVDPILRDAADAAIGPQLAAFVSHPTGAAKAVRLPRGGDMRCNPVNPPRTCRLTR